MRNEGEDAAANLASPTARFSREAVERAFARSRQEYLEDPSFQRVRCQAEAEAKQILDSILGKMSTADIRRFLDYVNTESIKGRAGLTRFGRHFTSILSELICGCPHEFNEWIGAVWRTKEDGLQDALASFLTNGPIKGTGTLLPTFVLYLRMPGAFTIWTRNLETNLVAAFSEIRLPGKQHVRYANFNRQVWELLIKPFRLAPQELDLVLSQLPKYLPYKGERRLLLQK